MFPPGSALFPYRPLGWYRARLVTRAIRVLVRALKIASSRCRGLSAGPAAVMQETNATGKHGQQELVPMDRHCQAEEIETASGM